MPSSTVLRSLFDMCPHSNSQFSPKVVLEGMRYSLINLAWENVLLPAVSMSLLLFYLRTGLSMLLHDLLFLVTPKNTEFDCPTHWPSRRACGQLLVRPYEEGKLALNISLEKLYRLKYSHPMKYSYFKGH